MRRRLLQGQTSMNDKGATDWTLRDRLRTKACLSHPASIVCSTPCVPLPLHFVVPHSGGSEPWNSGGQSSEGMTDCNVFGDTC